MSYLPSKDTEAQLPLRVLRLHGNHISEQGLACLVEYTRTDQCKLRELRYLWLHTRARRMSARLAHACLLCVCFTAWTTIRWVHTRVASLSHIHYAVTACLRCSGVSVHSSVHAVLCSGRILTTTAATCMCSARNCGINRAGAVLLLSTLRQNRALRELRCVPHLCVSLQVAVAVVMAHCSPLTLLLVCGRVAMHQHWWAW